MPGRSPIFSPVDDRHMLRALALAEKGRGRVEPNPLVGCVLVGRSNVVAEGWHRRFGGPHAEADALNRCRGATAGVTAYVTLEPCAHHGKTPPCADALIAARVARVVVPVADPFPAVAGKGFRRLRRAGIRVDVGLRRDEAVRLNAPFFKLRTRGLPWVILKWAQSLDGKIATRTGDSRWITGKPARREAHRLRARVDAVIVGIGTVLADDPMLTCRHVRPRRIAARLVVDSRLRTPLRSKLVQTAREVPTVIATTRAARQEQGGRVARLERAGCEIIALRSRAGRVDLHALLEAAGQREWTNVMVEGGGRLLGGFFDAGLADEALAFVAPRLIGGAGAPGPLGGTGDATVGAGAGVTLLRCCNVGNDRLYRFAL